MVNDCSIWTRSEANITYKSHFYIAYEHIVSIDEIITSILESFDIKTLFFTSGIQK